MAANLPSPQKKKDSQCHQVEILRTERLMARRPTVEWHEAKNLIEQVQEVGMDWARIHRKLQEAQIDSPSAVEPMDHLAPQAVNRKDCPADRQVRAEHQAQ